MPDQGLIDERIKQELRSLEGQYNEDDWQAIEPFVNSLEPPSAFKVNSKVAIIIVVCVLLGTGLYFAIPVIKKIQERQSTESVPDSAVSDTSSADPNFKPDTTLTRPVPVQPAPVLIDSLALKAKEDSIKAANEIKADTVKEPIPEEPKVKKKKKSPKKDSVPPQTTPPVETEDEDFLKKDVPIIAVPQTDPRIEDEKEKEKEPEMNLQKP